MTEHRPQEQPAQSERRPRWLAAVAIIAGVLVLLLLIALHLSGALGPGTH